MTGPTRYEPADIASRYGAVWNEPDPEARRAAVAALWGHDGVEFVEGAAFRGHEQLYQRVTAAYEQFVLGRGWTVSVGSESTRHGDVVVCTIQLLDDAEVAWAARSFLILDEGDAIREDYQVTTEPLKE